MAENIRIDEPLLEFARGTHVCPKAGIATHDVYDAKLKARRDKLLIGAVGTTDTLAMLAGWLGRCSHEIPGPLAEQPTMYPAFPGFNQKTGFKAEFLHHQQITRSLSPREIKSVLKTHRWNRKVQQAVDLYLPQIKFLAQNRTVDVIVCVIPNELYDAICKEEKQVIEETAEDPGEDDLFEMNFRRALKAKSMRYGKPLQLVRQLSLQSNVDSQQDDATKAWNFCTALYYKANQTVPWRLATNPDRPAVCYAGIGFYRSRDKKVLHTSLAQIFNELGDGVILRGGEVQDSKGDRRPHLTTEQAHDLLLKALTEYELAVGSTPGRLVVHKTSNYDDAEMDGLREATREMRVRAVDFVTIMDTDLRLFRSGQYPPYRGTHVELDQRTHLLYTRGSVEHYKTYPGLYIPQPIEVRVVESDESPGLICEEILGLTKMNWNNTRFDGKYPITIQCARKVGQVMKYLDPSDPEPQIRYSFYM